MTIYHAQSTAAKQTNSSLLLSTEKAVTTHNDFSYSLLAVSRSQLQLSNTLFANEPSLIQRNRQIEQKLARLASDSVAAHYTIDAMLGTLINLCEIVESYSASGVSKPTLIGQLHATAKLIDAYTKGENLPFSYVGQIDGGAFGKLLGDIKKGRATNSPLSEPWTLREKANAYEVLICSPYFREVISQIKHNPHLHHHVSHLIDNERLNALTYPDNLQQPRQLVPFTEKWQGPFTKHDARERSKKAGTNYTTAAQLLEQQRLNQRELRLARYNPKNRPDQHNTILRESYVMPLKEVIVDRKNGIDEWDVKADYAFAIEASKYHLPTTAGPSGTTKRFFDTALLLAPGIKSQLYLNTKKTEPRVQQQPTDTEFKELLRWLATAYLVDAQHHSMIEVSLGAAEHGLQAQWHTADLYQHPFSETNNNHK